MIVQSCAPNPFLIQPSMTWEIEGMTFRGIPAFSAAFKKSPVSFLAMLSSHDALEKSSCDIRLILAVSEAAGFQEEKSLSTSETGVSKDLLSARASPKAAVNPTKKQFPMSF